MQQRARAAGFPDDISTFAQWPSGPPLLSNPWGEQKPRPPLSQPGGGCLSAPQLPAGRQPPFLGPRPPGCQDPRKAGEISLLQEGTTGWEEFLLKSAPQKQDAVTGT